MNKKRFFVILAAIALVLGACFSPWKGDEGTFSISIGKADGKADGRTAWNDPEILKKLKHTITLSGIGPEQPSIDELKYGDTVNFSVKPGRWTITVMAFLGTEPYATGLKL